MKLHNLIILAVGLLQFVVLATPVRPSVPGIRGRTNMLRQANDAVRTREGVNVREPLLSATPIVTEGRIISDFEVKSTVEQSIKTMKERSECQNGAEVCVVLEGLARDLEASLLREFAATQSTLASHATTSSLIRGVHNIVQFNVPARDNALFFLKKISEGRENGLSTSKAVNKAAEELMIHKFGISDPTVEAVLEQVNDMKRSCA